MAEARSPFSSSTVADSCDARDISLNSSMSSPSPPSRSISLPRGTTVSSASTSLTASPRLPGDAPSPTPSNASSSTSTPNSSPPRSPSSRSVSFSTSTIVSLFLIFVIVSSAVFGLTWLVAPSSWGSDIDDVYDLLIAEAYYLIPAFMCFFLYRYPFEINVRYRFILICFIHFIVLCGSTHFVRVMSFGSAAVLSFFKLLTAIVSVLTALLMTFILPEALSLPLYTKQLERDLSEKYYLLKDASKKTKAANKAKDEFMAFLCHEIRNPLHCVCSNADFLSECLDDITAIIEMKRYLPEFQHQAHELQFKLERLQESAQYVKSIQASSELMTHIVNDVLDISRLRSGHIVFEKTPLDLRDLVSLSVQHFQSIAAARKIQLDYQFDTAVGPFVYSDRNRLHQILFNLISNCMKFTKEGGVRVMVLTEKKCLQLDEWRKKEGFVVLTPASDDDSSDSLPDSSSDEEKRKAAKEKEERRKEKKRRKAAAEDMDGLDLRRAADLNDEEKKAHTERNATSPSHLIDILGRKHRWGQMHSSRAVASRSNGREDDSENEPSKSLLAAPSTSSSTSISSCSTSSTSSSSSTCGSSFSAAANSPANAASALSSAIALATAVDVVETQQVVCLRFEDDGPGISESARKNLFTPFTSAKLTTIRTSAGLGLGIVKHLAKIMKGTLTVQTKMGRGSIFTVTIPFELSNEAAARKYAEEHNQIATKLSAADRAERDRRLKMYLRRYSTASNMDIANAARAASEAVLAQADSLSTRSTLRPDEGSVGSPSLPPAMSSPRYSNAMTLISSSSPLSTTKSLTITLPASGSASAAIAAAAGSPSMAAATATLSPPNRSNSPKACVLVVDDNDVNRKLMVRMCQQSGMDTEEAADGKQAVEATVKRTEKLKSERAHVDHAMQPYLVILMDISMPVMNGYEATQEIRRLGFSLPIIAVTANALSEEKGRALEAGMDAFVTKPIRRHEIVKVIERVVLEYEKRGKPEKALSKDKDKADGIPASIDSPIALVPISAISSFGKHKQKKKSAIVTSSAIPAPLSPSMSLSQGNTPANIIAHRSIAHALSSPSTRASQSGNSSAMPSPSLISTTLSGHSSGNASVCASSPSARSISLFSAASTTAAAPAPQCTPAASSTLQAAATLMPVELDSELASLKLSALSHTRSTYGTTSNSQPSSPSHPLL